jgi:preprotein translocase subunit SecG
VLVADIWSILSPILNILVLIVGGLILIPLVLIQRGKGGGLAGAFGAAGGSSAFGSRAGDLFTRITLGVFGVWLLLIVLQVWAVQKTGSSAGEPEPTFSGSDR